MSILFTQCFSAQINPNLIPYRKANLWGLADYKKKIIVNPALDYVMIFDKKLNAYQAVKDGKYGLIDDKGNWLISPISESEIYLKDRHLVVRKSQGLEYYFADTFEINKNYKKPDSSLATSSSVKPPESIELSEEDKKNLQNYSEEKGFNIYNWDKEYFKISVFLFFYINDLVIVFIIFIITLIISYFSFEWYEKPINKFIKKKFTK